MHFFGKKFGTWSQKRAGYQSKPALVPQKIAFFCFDFHRVFEAGGLLTKGMGENRELGSR